MTSILSVLLSDCETNSLMHIERTQIQSRWEQSTKEMFGPKIDKVNVI